MFLPCPATNCRRAINARAKQPRASQRAGHDALAGLVKRILSAKRAEIGIDDGMVRLSVGVEDVNDLIADLDHALRSRL